MTKFRHFILKQFKTASALRLGEIKIGSHRCVWWGMPVVVITALLISAWWRVGEFYHQYLSPYNPFLPKRLNELTWYNDPTHWTYVMYFFCGLSILYFYFVFVHFRIHPMTWAEWKILADEGLFSPTEDDWQKYEAEKTKE